MVGVLLAILDPEIVSESPGFGIENGSPILFVVVGRVLIDAEQNWKRHQAVTPQKKHISGARLSQHNFFIAYFRVLIKLSQTFVEPEGQPLCGPAAKEVSVFVINRCVGMLALRIEPQQNVVLIRRPHEKAGKLNLTLGQISLRLKRLEVFLVLESQDDNRSSGIDVGAGNFRVKN